MSKRVIGRSFPAALETAGADDEAVVSFLVDTTLFCSDLVEEVTAAVAAYYQRIGIDRDFIIKTKKGDEVEHFRVTAKRVFTRVETRSQLEFLAGLLATTLVPKKDLSHIYRMWSRTLLVMFHGEGGIPPELRFNEQFVRVPVKAV